MEYNIYKKTYIRIVTGTQASFFKNGLPPPPKFELFQNSTDEPTGHQGNAQTMTGYGDFKLIYIYKSKTTQDKNVKTFKGFKYIL